MCLSLWSYAKHPSALDQQGAPMDFGNDGRGHCPVLQGKLPGSQSYIAGTSVESLADKP